MEGATQAPIKLTRDLRLPIIPFLQRKGAEVAEWQTRTFEGRVGQPVGVQLPPSAPIIIGGPCYYAEESGRLTDSAARTSLLLLIRRSVRPPMPPSPALLAAEPRPGLFHAREIFPIYYSPLTSVAGHFLVNREW